MSPLGFVGLGHMGAPMAARLVDHGTELVVWNRTPEKAEALVARGAKAAETLPEVFDRCEVVLLMLAGSAGIDDVLGRTGDREPPSLSGRTVVSMGTVSPEYSLGLGDHVAARGGTYVEAPVSGSRVQAEAGALVGMLAGHPAALDRVEPLLVPMTASRVRVGPVPQALETKLAVNVFLIALVTGLAESVSFAERRGISPAVLQAVLDAGPMASATSRTKLAKLLGRDWDPQASIRDVHYNARLILDAARAASAPTPLLTVCGRLFAAAEEAGLGDADMAAVLEAVRSW